MQQTFYVVGNEKGFLERTGSGITQNLENARIVDDEFRAKHLAELYSELNCNYTGQPFRALKAVVTL